MIPNPFKPAFFAGNRAKLIDVLPENAIVILAAHRSVQQAADSSFPFWQEPNFQYLTGITEPDWRLVIDCSRRQSWLVGAAASITRKTFDGALDSETAKATSGVERVMTQRQFQRWLKTVVSTGRAVYTLLPQTRMSRWLHLSLNPAQRLLVRQLRDHGLTPRDCRTQLAQLRAMKQKPELEAIRAAIAVTTKAFALTLAERANFTYEYQYEASMTNHIRFQGAEGHAYSPIVAAGLNACTLHYNRNNVKIRKHDWLLMDIGARVHGYAADITRTIPLGDTTAWQREVFAAVERVHDDAIRFIEQGADKRTMAGQVDDAMMDALKQLGLLKRRSVRNLRRYFPHSIGHGLGLDVHDSLGPGKDFLPGMVLTIEPGIYVPEKKFGVRLENNILITETGVENLSGALPNLLV